MADERSDGWPRRVRVDAYTRVCLTAIAVLLAVLVFGLWADGAPRAGELRAAEKFLDTSSQRKALLDQHKQTNAKLDELISLLRTGRAKVRLVREKADQAGGGQVAPRKGG